MQLSHKVGIALGLLLVAALAGVIGTYLVMSAQQRVAVSEAQSEIYKATAAQAMKDADAAHQESIALQNRVTERDDAADIRYKAALAQIQRLSASPQTAAQGLHDAAKLPDPIVEQSNPNGSKSFVFTPDNVVSLYQNVGRCEADRDQLETCKADKIDLKAAIEKEKAASKSSFDAAMAWQKSAENWENTARGGSKAQRFWRGAKYAGIGGTATIGILCLTGHCPK